MSLIGNHDAYTSWSPTVVLPTQTYDNSQNVPYVAPQAPIVVTNPTTNEGTVLDSDFIDQIVRRNQENIYDSTKAQKIPLLTDENDIAYAKQIDTDLLKTKTRYMVSANENETHFTQNLKIDELLIRANGGEYKNLWDEIVSHSTDIVANATKNNSQDTVLGSNTTDITALREEVDNTILPQIATNINSLTTHDASITTLNTGLSTIKDDIDNVLLPQVSLLDTDIDALKLLTSKMGFDNTTNPNDTWVGFNPDNIHLNTNTYVKSLFYKVDGTNWTNVSGYFQKVLDNESQINSINVAQTAMDANIYNQISNQVTNRTLSSDGTVIRESIDARFTLYGLDTELVVRGEFFGNFTAGAQNVKGHVRKAAFHNVDGTSLIHNDITFVIREGDYWKMTRYYWNPSSQTVVIGAGRHGNNTLPEMRYVPDALNNVMPIGNITNTDDLTAEVIHSNFWTHANANNTGNGHIVQNNVFTYHMRNLVYTPTTERIATKSEQDVILTMIEPIANPPVPYYNYNWFAMEGVGVNSSELRLPENSVIFAGSLYRTRETDNQQTKLIPYLDNQGRLNSGHLWEAEFANQAYGAANGEKYPNQYLAGLVPAMPIADVQSNLRYEYFLNGEGHWTRNYTNQLNTISTTFTQILNRVEDQITGLVAINSSGRTTSGGLVTFGGDAAITGSPAAIGYINELGRLDTARLFDQIFNDQVFGVEDPDTTSSRRKSNAYLSGLVPTAENVADRTTKYLRADGTWSVVPIITDYLTTAEVDAKISAIPTPDLSNYYTKSETDNVISQFDTSAEVDAKISAIPAPDLSNYYTKSVTDNLISQFDTSAEVDAKISAIPADTKLADIHREVYNSSTGQVMWSLGSLGYISMPESHFAGNIFWKPTGQGLTNLNVMNDRVNTLITTTNALPDFDAITSANKFCITNTANGGTISYITPTTSNINEGSNLYYTDDRVASKITASLQGGEIANIVTNQLQAQNFIANSDIRLKENIRLISDSDICGLEPVQYRFKKDTTKRLRYGFIAQDVEEILPDLVHTDDEGIKGINYQDIIALLVKDNQNLRSNILDMAKVLAEFSQRLTTLEISCKYR